MLIGFEGAAGGEIKRLTLEVKWIQDGKMISHFL
jgi:hypothetical protein